MDLWKYYDGDLKYPDLISHSHEKEIAKTNTIWAFDYTSKHGKDEELEPIIAKNAECSYWYAIEVLDDRFELGEKAIAKDYYFACRYAKQILNGPFPLGEPAIAKSSYYSYMYARFALKEKPFPLGEPVISKDETYSKKYTKEILKKDFILDGKLICKYEG